MSRHQHVRLMASYNAWMNAKLLEAALELPEAELIANKKAFFGSILGTLNHLVVADTIWLNRFASHPARYSALEPLVSLPMPDTLDQMVCPDIFSLQARRKLLDDIILDWAEAVTEADLDYVLHYANTKGVPADKNFYSLVMHFFNHQTHHRGQITTLLYQVGIDMGITDLVALIPDEL
ncbi:MAG: DinB family protein [Methylovulum miyakonense]|uniref:DinB family protein n=1 Tax=Methylovulum miyakonense TaxID=645578 RepID=UPI003BB7EC05